MKKALTAMTLGTVFLSTLAAPVSAATNIDNHSDYVMGSWDSTDDWRIVDATSNVYGENYATAYDENSTVINQFSAGFEINYDDYKMTWNGITYFPSSKNHKIKIGVNSVPSPISTPQVVYTYDNTKEGYTMSPYTKYVLDWLWDLAGAYTQLTLPPGPWELINNPTGVTTTPVQNDSVTVKFNADPTVMAVEYKIQPYKPISAGYYSIRIDSTADAGVLVNTPYLTMDSESANTLDKMKGNGRTAPGAELKDKAQEMKTGKQETLKLSKGSDTDKATHEKVVVHNEPLNKGNNEKSTGSATEGVVGPNALTWLSEGTISMLNFGSFTVDVTN